MDTSSDPSNSSYILPVHCQASSVVSVTKKGEDGAKDETETTITMNRLGIAIVYNPFKRQEARIQSSLRVDHPAAENFNKAIEALELMILTHFLARLNVIDPDYINGVEKCVLALDKSMEIVPSTPAKS